MGKIYHLIYLVLLNGVLLMLNFYALFGKKKASGKNQKILAFPYLPTNFPGGAERIGNWQSFFEEDGIQFDVLWAFSDEELFGQGESLNSFFRYWLHIKILMRRTFQFFKIRRYDTVWIQRAFIPLFPYKDAYWEKLISRICHNVTIDHYDANYAHNYKLTINAVKSASNVTVSTPYLMKYYKRFNNNIQHVRQQVNEHMYYQKKKYKDENGIQIGWMGSPGNSEHLQIIEKQLEQIEKEFPKVHYHFICRDLAPLKLQNLTVSKWGDPGFDYYRCISEMDIGIVPYIGENEILKAKPAGKTLEFMISAVPIIASEYGIFDKMQHEVDCLVAYKKDEWYNHLKDMINSEDLRRNLGVAALNTYKKFHQYERVYPIVKDVLLNRGN